MEIIVGRPQNILRVIFDLDSDSDVPTQLDVYWCMAPRRRETYEERHPHPAELLIDAAGEPKYFSGVLERWLERHEEWGDARARFSVSFSSQNRYGIDRLVGAANMFDILPDSLFPSSPLPDDLAAAQSSARELFRDLPRSLERDSVLGALGRINKPSLKRKIRSRAHVLRDVANLKFPELEMVLDQAVDCRNHYVHGAPSHLSYEENMDFMSFFTQALQFVFSASDLVDCGWDVARWSKQSTTGSHPFNDFRVNYRDNVSALKEALSRRKQVEEVDRKSS